MSAVMQSTQPIVEPGASQRTISQSLAEFVAHTDHAAIPAAVRSRALYLILDAIGCGYAGTRFDFTHHMFSGVLDLSGPGTYPVIGFQQRLPLRDSVMMNGYICHGLDYDDTHTAAVTHLTVSTFPTALGVATQAKASGRDLISAYVLGLEAAARVGMVVKGNFHQVGFHPTGLVGVFGCALVAGRLFGLNAAQLAMAQGIALSLGTGSLEFLEDGAWTKRLHPGWAAASGITAAGLARQGFVAPLAAYEGRYGLYKSHLGPLEKNCDYAMATAGLGQDWELPNVAIKPFPLCHFTHASVDSAIALHKAGVNVDDIASVRVKVPAEVVGAVCEPVANKKNPQSEYDAKFSIPFTVATGLIKGKFGLVDLEPAAMRDPHTLALAQRVNYEIDPQSGFPKYYSGEVVLKMKDGREIAHREFMNRGCSDRPISDQEIEKKFFENALTAMAKSRAERIRDAVLNLESATQASSLGEILAG
jgi:2-methylcitrate dehydratase PrpD